ncbi:MAG TPA: chemotaxis-specific protein-glutamate methyltransferase CheB [Gaiellaceae bacterium]|nr:chemotaxis-specific protein-glutamate methyltransferase CheB [Gaiellaceae bacterium]
MTPGPRRTRVLVCEDSKTFATALTRTLEHGGEIEVVGVRTSAEAAIADLQKLAPDLITMDIELPGMSGLEAVEHIMSVRPTPILVLSSHVASDSKMSAAALAAGALDAVAKSDLSLTAPDGVAAVAFRRRVLMLSRARVIRHPRARLVRKGGRPSAVAPIREGTVVGICASTGGPQALLTVLSALPATYPIPILVVQHIAAGFTDGLAQWLDGVVPLPVRVAADGAPLEPGVTVAAEGAHLVLDGARLALDRITPAGLHRPSADVLLRSIAAGAGAAGVAVVLTGMGRDGAAGLGEVERAGGLTIAQDEATSAVFGMPKEAAKHGARLVLPVEEIAAALAAVTLGQRKKPQ